MTGTRTVVIIGRRPRETAAEALGTLTPGCEAVVLVLGLDPTTAQRRFTEAALASAAERRFVLLAELVSSRSRLEELLLDGDDVHVVAHPRELRRWRLEPVLSPPGAR